MTLVLVSVRVLPEALDTIMRTLSPFSAGTSGVIGDAVGDCEGLESKSLEGEADGTLLTVAESLPLLHAESIRIKTRMIDMILVSFIFFISFLLFK